MLTLKSLVDYVEVVCKDELNKVLVLRGRDTIELILKNGTGFKIMFSPLPK